MPDDALRRSGPWIDPALQFELLYEQEHDSVFRTIRGIVHDAAEVDDLVQECFARAYRARHGYRPDAPPGAWLHRIAVNTAISHLRARKLSRALPLEMELPDEDRELRRAEARAALEEAMADLSPKVRAAVLLHHLGDRTRAEIAASLGVPSGTVASRIAKGMALMRTRLQEDRARGADGGEEPAP